MSKYLLMLGLAALPLISDCNFVSGTGNYSDLSFGEYYPYDNIDANGYARKYFSCDNGESFDVSVTKGSGLSNGQSLLEYSISYNVSDDSTYGNKIEIFGNIPGGQENVSTGAYTDNITVTVDY